MVDCLLGCWHFEALFSTEGVLLFGWGEVEWRLADFVGFYAGEQFGRAGHNKFNMYSEWLLFLILMRLILAFN